MDKNTTQLEIYIEYAARQLFAVVMDSYASTCVLCGVLAIVIYKIISSYVRKSIDAKGRSLGRGDNEEENISASGGNSEVSKEQTSNPSKNNSVRDILANGMEPEVFSADNDVIGDKESEQYIQSRRRNSRHPSEKDKPFLEQLQIMNLLQGNVTPDILDNQQPPIEISEWFACQNHCEGSTYDLKVTLQDAQRMAIVDFYYGYDFSRSQGICKKVSHTFKKYGPGIRYLLFRHRIGKDVEINNEEYCCKLSDGIIKVERNKANFNS